MTTDAAELHRMVFGDTVKRPADDRPWVCAEIITVVSASGHPPAVRRCRNLVGATPPEACQIGQGRCARHADHDGEEGCRHHPSWQRVVAAFWHASHPHTKVSNDMTDIGQMEWMRALRDDPNVIGGRLLVLVMLASRMRDDGTGWALHWQLVADAGVNERTVERALEWALDAGYLQRLGRGHRVLDDAVASGYRLTLPTPPAS